MTVGYVNVGDINNGNGSLSVGGGLSSASKSSGNGRSTVRVNFPAQGSYVPMISFQSLGNEDNDNDLEQPVIITVASTYFTVFLDETSSTSQNLRMFVMLMKY